MSIPITALARRWGIFLNCGRGWTASSTAIWTCSKIFWRPLWTARNFANSPNPRFSQRPTHPWSEAGSAPTVGPHALPGALLLPRRRRHLHHPRLTPANPAGTPASTGRVQAWISRYDLWKLRAKGLVEKIPHSRRYRLLPHGYQICVVFLKLYEKIYAPLTAGI